MAAAAVLAFASLNMLLDLGHEASEQIATPSARDELEALAKRRVWQLLGIGTSGTLLSLWALWSASRIFSVSLAGLAGRLESSSNTVLSGAELLAGSSTELADGASRQAASLEETSSSLEEMAAMVQQNAENAKQANELTRSALQAAGEGAEEMRAVSDAMAGIKTSSDEVAQVIKTIDEIAFQTNILALNAAVEAARAGEYGAGFAVVADEVRALAMRSAEAASGTSSMIENAIKRTEQGVSLTSQVMSRLESIVQSSREVDQIAQHVSEASHQQQEGIEQLRAAVTEIDAVTQRTAASAQEGASSTQDLRQQAEIVRSAVQELHCLLGNENASAGSLFERARSAGYSRVAPLEPRAAPASGTRESATATAGSSEELWSSFSR